jgi:hypothetical protein
MAICENLKAAVIDGTAAEIQKRERIDLVGANRRARDFVGEKWSDRHIRVALVPGKEALSHLSDWAQKKYSVGFGTATVAANMTSAEVPDEIKEIIEAIEAGQDF